MERVIVVDDEQGLADISRRMLIKTGYEAVTASTGEEALELMLDNPFDIAVIDVQMPDIDGVELLRKIKKLYPQIEVIMVSAETTIETAVESLKLGAFDYVSKPFNLSELLSAVKRALDYAKLKAKETIFRETTYLYQLAQEIDRTRSKHELLTFILNRASTVLHADTASILMFQPEMNTLRLVASYGFEFSEGTEIKMGDRIVGWVAQNKEPLLLVDIHEYPQFKNFEVRKDIVSSLVVPLIKHDALLGVICLNRLAHLTNTKFTALDLESLKIFATHASLVIALHHQNVLKK